jgi:hypothetical protein
MNEFPPAPSPRVPYPITVVLNFVEYREYRGPPGGIPPFQPFHRKRITKYQCCGSGSGIRCLFDPWIRDPGMVESQHPDFLELGNHFFGVKILKFFDADPGSGMETVRIRDGKSRIRDPG